MFSSAEDVMFLLLYGMFWLVPSYRIVIYSLHLFSVFYTDWYIFVKDVC